MDKLFGTLRPLIRLVCRRPWLLLAAAGLVSAAGGTLASRLRTDTDLANLLPRGNPQVQALERLRDAVGGESHAALIIECPDTSASRAFAEAAIPRLLAVKQPNGEAYFNRIQYRRDTEFLQNNALYLATDDELDTLEDFLLEKQQEARLEANPLFVSVLDDKDADEQAGGSFEERLKVLRSELLPREYPISDDGGTLVLRVLVNGSKTNIGFLTSAYGALEEVTRKLDPTSFHPEMRVEAGGRLLRHLMEVRAVTDDVQNSFLSGVLAVLLVVTLYFCYKSYQVRARPGVRARVALSELARMPVTALVIGVPLGMSLTWTFGIAWLVYETLNLMTSTLALVLFGLGIDFGIHFYARYAEERGEGREVADAIEETFVSAGPPITVSALTTAAAMGVLMVADFRGFSEFGGIAAMGLLAALVAMLLVLPALLVVFERSGLVNLASAPGSRTEEVASGGRFPAARTIVVLSLSAAVVAVALLDRVAFEYDFGALEPKFPAYDQVKRKEYRVYPPSPRNPAYVIADNPEDVPAIVRVLRQRAIANGDQSTILKVESLQERLPLDATQQRKKLERLAEIRELLADDFLNAGGERTEDLATLRRAAQSRTPVPLEELPDELRSKFQGRDGKVGNFVLIFPSVDLSDGRESIRFADEVSDIDIEGGKRYQAASTSVVAATMLRLMLGESGLMVGLTFSFIVLVILLVFRSIGWGGIALMPLVVGVLWMLALVEWLDLSLNFYNLVVLPAVLGIGDDCGVHLAHRYREEGPGSLRLVLRSTGEHITMGALTTMIGFAGMLGSFHPGLNSIGQLAVVGIGATLLSALVFLPAGLQLLEDRRRPV